MGKLPVAGCHLPAILMAACGFATLLSTVARAQDIWTITSADFSETRGAVTSLAPAGITFRNAVGDTAQLPWSNVLELSRSAEPGGIPDGVWVALLTGGQRLVGGPVSFADESLTWSTAVGEFIIPLNQLIAICRGGLVERARGKRPPQDTVVLANGDVLGGIVESIAPDGVALANSPKVDWDAVAMIKFAEVDDAQNAAAAEGYLVRIVGGAVLAGRSVEFKANQLQLSDGAATARTVPIGSVLSIEHRNGPVTWLTDAAPIEQMQKPYFAAAPPAIVFNTGAAGAPIRDGERAARCGIIAASYTRLVYAVDPSYEAFRTRLAIDGALPYANAVVRIRVGESVAYELADLSAATPVQTVVVPLNGAKQITLEVDYGKTYDVQDRVVFIEPALLKKLPVPTTQPGAPATQ